VSDLITINDRCGVFRLFFNLFLKSNSKHCILCVLFSGCISVAYKPLAHKSITAPEKKNRKTPYAEVAVIDSGQLLQFVSESFPYFPDTTMLR